MAAEFDGEWTDGNVGRGRAFQFRSPGGHQHELFWDVKPLDLPEKLRT